MEAGGTLVLGDGTAAPTGSVEVDGAAVGIDYAVEQAGGNLVIDGGAVWEEAGQNPTAYFVSASGERVGYRNVGFSTTSGPREEQRGRPFRLEGRDAAERATLER